MVEWHRTATLAGPMLRIANPAPSLRRLPLLGRAIWDREIFWLAF